MPADLPALAARLRDADGKYSDDAILRGLREAFGSYIYGEQDEGDEPDVQLFVGLLSGEPDASIDAAVALIRAVEPDVWWSLRQPSDHDDPRAVVTLEGRQEPYIAGARAATPALALCLALVEWRIAHDRA